MESKDESRQLGYVVPLGVTSFEEISDSQIEMIKSLILKHSVVCIKGIEEQTAAGLLNFTERFGDIVRLPKAFALGNVVSELPRVTRISNMKEDGTIISGHHGAEYWHNDGDFWSGNADNGSPKNNLCNFLLSSVVPQEGGGTAFFDTQLALENMPAELRADLESKKIVVDAMKIPDFLISGEEVEPFPLAKHDIIHTHFKSGIKSIYLGCDKSDIEGLSYDETQALFKRIFSHLESSDDYVYAHKWESGDLLIWDNVSCMHRGLGGYGDYPRLLYRTQAWLDYRVVDDDVERKAVEEQKS